MCLYVHILFIGVSYSYILSYSQVNCPRCNNSEHMCVSDGKCLPSSVTCNGQLDCTDGSDEFFELCGMSLFCTLC